MSFRHVKLIVYIFTTLSLLCLIFKFSGDNIFRQILCLLSSVGRVSKIRKCPFIPREPTWCFEPYKVTRELLAREEIQSRRTQAHEAKQRLGNWTANLLSFTRLLSAARGNGVEWSGVEFLSSSNKSLVSFSSRFDDILSQFSSKVGLLLLLNGFFYLKLS